jgi:septal ring factor EnvC (AmiA/AmiB activator)
MRLSRPLLAAALFVASLPSPRAADRAVEQVDDLATQWTSLQRQQDALLSSWRQDKPVLEQQLDLLERESKSLSEVLEQSSKQQDQVEQRRLDLLRQQTQLEQEQDALSASLGRIAAGLHELQSQLPPPLVAAFAKDLPKLDEPERSASEKLQTALALLGQLADFEQKVTVNETVMKLADGEDHLVKQVYLGTGQGWYVSSDLKHAAVGAPSIDGWSWTETDEAAAINRVLAILERKQSPDLVSVPARLANAPTR